MISTELRERIRELMVDFGLNQKQLSEETGIGVSTISNLLRMPKKDSPKIPNVRLSTLYAIAYHLGCHVDIAFTTVTEEIPEW